MEQTKPEQEFAELAQVVDTINMEEALSDPDSNEWKDAIKNEYLSQIKCQTWDIVDRPSDRQVNGNRLILKNKFKSDGSIEKRKARLVAKGYAQKENEDFCETFAPVVRASSIRIIIALSAEFGLTIHQMDIVTAYLNGNLEEEVYMEVPDLLEGILIDIVKENVPDNGEIIQTSRKCLQRISEGKNKVKKFI